MSIVVTSALTMSLGACQQAQRENPLLQESTAPFGAPDFSKIQTSDYLPAFETAILQTRDEIATIVDNPDSATFENTILAYEESGKVLDRVSRVFFALVEADKTPELGEIEKKVQPMLTDLENEIMFNKQLFERVKQVYDKEYASLQGEDQKLLEETYKEFVRKGALLSDDKMERMKAINKRISDLQTEWGDMLPDATNDAVVWVEKKEDLAGLSEADIAQCQKDAENLGKKAPYAIVIVNTTQQAILASLDNRELRKKVFEASVHRADGTGKYNTFALVSEIARLRAEQAEIMGYPNYAAYSLEKTMAKTPENVYAFLKNLISQYAPKADAETKAIEDFARKTQGPDFQLQPYDRFYYSAKMKKELLNVSDDEVKPYFNVDSVLINGVFYAASRAYGLTFKLRDDIPLYHPDMKAFEVVDKDGKTKALFYTDYFRRPTKRGGAWMDGFQKQSRQWNQIPVIFNVCNSAKAPEGQPSLLTWDEVTTMFHEFGHALHGILSDCQYNRLSGTSVARDFVEMPSQFNESFASIPEVFDHYARHCETGEPMPADLKERMLQSINFQTAYALGENLAATCVDLAWHMLASKDVPAADKAADFETEALRQIGLLNEQIPPRYHTSYFNHVWGGGYAAGYYSYLWTEVLAVNIAHGLGGLEGLYVKGGMQQHIQGFGVDLHQGFFFADHAFVDQIAGDLDGGLSGALAAAALEHVQLAVFYGEFHILHVAVVVFQDLAHFHELLVGFGEFFFHLGDGHGGAHAGHHVFALGVGEEFAHQHLFAGGGIAGEGHAGAGIFIQVAEHHGHHVHGSAPGIGDIMIHAVHVGAGVVPGTEHGADGFVQLHLGIGGEVLAQLLFVFGFELAGKLLEVGGGQFGVVLDALLFLHFVDEGLKILLAHFHDHVGEHLDEAAVAVVHEALELGIGVALDHGGDHFVVQAQVQDGVHHAGHGSAGAGTHGNQQGVLKIAELFAVDLFHGFHVLHDFGHDLIVDLPAVFIVLGAGFGGDGKTLGNRQADIGHFSQVRAFAAQQFAHGGVALGKQVYILLAHGESNLLSEWY